MSAQMVVIGEVSIQTQPGFRQRLVFPQRRLNHTGLELRRKTPPLPCHLIVSLTILYPEAISP